jgi:hypothetical protein
VKVPDSPVPVRAYRVWTVRETPAGLRLRSVWFPRDGLWPPFRRMEAECFTRLFRRLGHRAPKSAHSCGIYAMKSVEAVWEWALDNVPAGARPLVAGEVWCWGTVVEGQRGYRCQYAYPASLLEAGFAAPGEEAAYVASLSEIYGLTS